MPARKEEVGAGQPSGKRLIVRTAGRIGRSAVSFVPATGDRARSEGAVAPGQAGWSSFSLAIFSRHTSGASWWTFWPSASTATVTGKSATSNS